MTTVPPVPKPRTRFNIGGGHEAPHQSNSVATQNEANTAVDNSKANGVVSVGIYPAIERSAEEASTSQSFSPTIGPRRVAPPPPPTSSPPTLPCPPPPSVVTPYQRPSRPPPPAPGWKVSAENVLPPLHVHPPPQHDAGSQHSSSSVSTPSPPVPPRPKRWEMKAHADSDTYDTVAGSNSAAKSKPKSRGIDYIENPIYMSLFSLKKLSFKKKATESTSAAKDNSSSSQVESSSCCLPSGRRESNGMADQGSARQSPSDFSILTALPDSELERAVPMPPRVVSSSREGSYEDRYTPAPRRSTAPSINSLDATSMSLDQFDKVVEVAEVPEITSDAVELVNLDSESTAGDHYNSTTVAYFGDVSLHIGKKERKKAHARLRNMKLSFHEDDTEEECVAGPFSLLGCELICQEENTVTIRLNEREPVKSVVFTAEKDIDSWMLMLGECWLSEYDLLRSSVQELNTCGTFWLRQGATSDWMFTAAALHGRTMFYVLLDSPDYIYELDVRKILLLRERVDKVDWCPKCKKKDQKGPFLISLEGCALYLECCDDMCTPKWFTAIQNSLSMSPTVLEDFRLTSDNIPILVDKCLRFVAAYGIRSEGIYRRNGKILEAKEIYKGLTEDPVKTHIASSSEETVYAVADVLRQFFRRLKSPLFPPAVHQEIFDLVGARASVDNAIRYQEYRRILQKLPLVHYHTLRKLVAHLSEVVKYSDVNKATVENVAKVFGPSLFNVNGDDNGYENCSEQIGAIIDLINGYDVIFEVTSREEICRAMVEQAQMHKASNSTIARADGLLVPIHVWERENRPFNVKIDLAAEEVCRKAVARRGFDAPQDGNYAIFEVILGGALSRRLPPFEKLSVSVIDHWLTWQCTDGYLLFDHDNWPYNNAETDFFSGKVKIAEPGSKTFHSYDVSVEGGVKITASKHDKIWKEWVVADSVFYSGSAANRKAPNAHNVTVFDKQSGRVSDKLVGYCLSFRLMPERTRFLNMIQFIETGGQPPPLVHL